MLERDYCLLLKVIRLKFILKRTNAKTYDNKFNNLMCSRKKKLNEISIKTFKI